MAEHHLITLAPFFHHLRDKRGRVLKVGVQQHYCVAGSMVDARGERLFLAEIAAEFERADAVILGVPAGEAGEGVVLAAVVDGDDLPVGSDGFEHRDGGFEERIGSGRFVIHGHDDGKQRHYFLLILLVKSTITGRICSRNLRPLKLP